LVALLILVGGVVLGMILSPITRKLLGKDDRPDPVRQLAPVIGSFVFWMLVAFALVMAVSVSSPETLKPLPARLVAYFPKVLVAGLLLIGGTIAGTLAGMAIGRAVMRASGARNPQVERGVKVLIVGLTAVLAVAQLGINTTIIDLLLAAVSFGLAAASALLIGLGGRDVARQIAAGRAVRGLVHVGDLVTIGEITGSVVQVRAALVEIQESNGDRVHVPLARLLESGVRVRRAGA
jgi:hypothetical protein